MKTKVTLHDYGMSFIINNAIWLVSLDYLNTLIMMKSVTESVAADIRGHGHLLTSNRWKE